MNDELQKALTEINVKDYVDTYVISNNFVSFRYTPSPETASLRANRYNPDGIECFYIAESQEIAALEIRHDYFNKTLYQVKDSKIDAFNAHRFAEDFSFSDHLTGAQEDGGYIFCQDIANFLTSSHGLSGIAYPSRQGALNNQTGMCIALLPQRHQLTPSGELKIFEEIPRS